MLVLAEENCTASAQGPLEDMGIYLQDIRRFPILNEQDEKALTLRCAQGDEDAIRLLICSNLRLVVKIARDYKDRGVPLKDLVQEGSIGLLSAAKKFDPNMGFRFSTYASKWIRNGVLRCLTEHGALIRIPGYTSEKMQKVIRTRAELAQQIGEEPTDEQLADKLEISMEKLQQLLQLIPQFRSLDAAAGEDAVLQGFLEDNLASPPQEELVRQELHRIMDLLLSQLSERQSLVIRLHYGMEDGVCHSLESIGRRLDVSKERARQIEQQAMERLKKNGAAFGLEDFLNE